MKNKDYKRFILYLIRWQLSTPILAICLSILSFNTVINTIIANLVGRHNILLGRQVYI